MNFTYKDRDSRSRSGREVNSLLHTLRGEQFRHSQNLLRSKAHLAAVASRSYNDPSLPFSDIYRYAQTQGDERLREQDIMPPPLPVIQDGQLQHGYPRGPVPGPPVPKSWSGLFKHRSAQVLHATTFRREALSLILSHTPWSFGSSDVPLVLREEKLNPSGRAHEDAHDNLGSPVPPLAQTCLRVLLAQFPDTAEFRDELLEILPPHIYRDVLRYTAVHDPLPSAKLYALCERHGHVDGELIVVGPQATLQRDVLVSASPAAVTRQERPGWDGEENDRGEGPSTRDTHAAAEDEDSWDLESSSSQDVPPPMHTLVVLNTPISVSTLFAFPLTLTRLALLAIPIPAPVHRLPRICPLLEVVDLSYNPWLNDPPEGKGTVSTESTLERIEWEKWARLRVLGLRQCNVPPKITTRVNRGRLLHVVHVLGVEDRTFGSSLTTVEGMMKSLPLSDYITDLVRV